MSAARVAVPLHGRVVEVPVAALEGELDRSGPIASLALIEAITLCSEGKLGHRIDGARATMRLGAALEGAQPGPVALLTILSLVRLDDAKAAPALQRAAETLASPLSTTARIAALLLTRQIDELVSAIGDDAELAQRTPLVLTQRPPEPRSLARLTAALLAALARAQPTLGVTAYRAFLGDLAEAAFRALQGGADATELLGDGREALVDRLCGELPGTPDLVAARGMAWLLGAIAPGDDAARDAIERARARFRDPDFHRDCAAMLGELPDTAWPPHPTS
jgi:hypothetical protein